MSDALDEEKRKILIAAFRMPSVQTMTSRKSSITNAFVSAVIPVIVPEPADIAEALAILGMQPDDVRCAYCGDVSTEWDHLRPLVVKRRPTGYISEIANLVPACGKCNQSKGNKNWKTWMLSNAKRSPTGRGLDRVADRITLLARYELWRPPHVVDFEQIIGKAEWERYWHECEKVIEDLRAAQSIADAIREHASRAIRAQ